MHPQGELLTLQTERAAMLASIVEHSPAGVAVYVPIRDEIGSIVDFDCTYNNERINTLSGIPAEQRSGLSLKQMLFLLNISFLFDQYVQVATEGFVISREQYNTPTSKWLLVSVTQFGEGCLLMVTDITELKLTQQSLKQAAEFNKRILDAAFDGIYTLEAVPGPDGKVRDFRYIQCNKRFEEITGISHQRIIGKTFLEYFPNTLVNGIFDKLCNVLVSGKAMKERNYYSVHLEKWFEFKAVKLSDVQLVVTVVELEDGAGKAGDEQVQ
jgi:PAS domain-containing protein